MDKIIVYGPNQRAKIGWIRTWIILTRNVIDSWELIIHLFKRDFLISFVLTIIVLVVFKVYPSWMIIIFPVLIIPMMLLGSGIGLISSVISVVASDIQKAIAFAMGLLMYITPVIYSDKVDNPLLQTIIKWNPLTYLIGAVRDSTIYGRIEHFDRFMISSGISLLFFLITWRLFYISEEKVIEKMI
jgi:lipopolysaccharide transport system permease protein